jgi:hypothetical protein
LFVCLFVCLYLTKFCYNITDRKVPVASSNAVTCFAVAPSLGSVTRFDACT